MVEREVNIIIDGKQTTVKIRYSQRAKNIAIRVSHGGEAELVLPIRANLTRAKQFLLDRLSWLREKLAQTKHDPVDQTHIPIFGEQHYIQHIDSQDELSVAIHEESKVIRVSCPTICIEPMLISYLKDTLFKTIKPMIEKTAVTHLLKYKSIRISASISKWGSCSSQGHLVFNWRLIFTPKNIISYLIAHELAHTKHMNHSQEFWALVKTLHPDYIIAEQWLKTEVIKLNQILKAHK